ncbi:hypothetical protein F3Y22_tig00112988pilonHSYRG00050 [Hibiscus syriacus]|uniref:Uncharacterized protein n=1 Tax=Hibiscus syriacus TaxID=106335 RepID=A0A6A2WS73_HIBSY|nr:hypothetical protein F3Y22_tig00112988pilonHSYRG00050 [Hibiscus syriacus]
MVSSAFSTSSFRVFLFSFCKFTSSSSPVPSCVFGSFFIAVGSSSRSTTRAAAAIKPRFCSFWKVVSHVINKALKLRIYVLAFTILVCLPLQILLMGLSAFWTQDNPSTHNGLAIAVFLTTFTCAGVGEGILVVKPIADSLNAICGRAEQSLPEKSQSALPHAEEDGVGAAVTTLGGRHGIRATLEVAMASGRPWRSPWHPSDLWAVLQRTKCRSPCTSQHVGHPRPSDRGHPTEAIRKHPMPFESIRGHPNELCEGIRTSYAMASEGNRASYARESEGNRARVGRPEYMATYPCSVALGFPRIARSVALGCPRIARSDGLGRMASDAQRVGACMATCLAILEPSNVGVMDHHGVEKSKDNVVVVAGCKSCLMHFIDDGRKRWKDGGMKR